MSRHLMNQALRAAREGRALHKFKDDDAGITASFVVSTLAAVYHDIPVGKQVVVYTVNYGVATPSKTVDVKVVGCDAITGGGTPTQKMHIFRVANGAANQGELNKVEYFDVPLVFKYSDGHRSVSLSVKATDTNTVATYGWCGWVEDEGTLS